jgi:hypothetical protein
VVNGRLAELRQSLEATIEYHRIGAIMGKIYDADGSTILDLHTTFGVSQTTVDFAFTTATTDIRGALMTGKRAAEAALGGTAYGYMGVWCGYRWWDSFIAHAKVESAFDRWEFGRQRQEDLRSGFEFAGVVIKEHGAKIGDQWFVPPDEAYMYPIGVPGLFKTHYAPADFIEAVNTVGLPAYAKQERMEMDRGIKIHAQSNPLCMCHRPAALIKCTMS